MMRTIYYCDYCQVEVGEHCKFMLHTKLYSDEHGMDLEADYHFCSKKCLNRKVKKWQELKIHFEDVKK